MSLPFPYNRNGAPPYALVRCSYEGAPKKAPEQNQKLPFQRELWACRVDACRRDLFDLGDVMGLVGVDAVFFGLHVADTRVLKLPSLNLDVSSIIVPESVEQCSSGVLVSRSLELSLSL